MPLSLCICFLVQIMMRCSEVLSKHEQHHYLEGLGQLLGDSLGNLSQLTQGPVGLDAPQSS